MRYSESVVGLVFLLMSVFFWNMSLRLTPASAQYPQIIIVLLGLTSLIVLIRGLVKKHGFMESVDWKKVLPILVLTIIYAVGFDLLDFKLSTSLYVLLFISVLGLTWPFWKKITLSIGLTLLLYVTFGILFQVPLP